MSMKQTWLPARLVVRQRSLTKPKENWALPAPITLILTAVDIVTSPFGRVQATRVDIVRQTDYGTNRRFVQVRGCP